MSPHRKGSDLRLRQDTEEEAEMHAAQIGRRFQQGIDSGEFNSERPYPDVSCRSAQICLQNLLDTKMEELGSHRSARTVVTVTNGTRDRKVVTFKLVI